MIVLVSVCNISWWMIALSMIVPATLAWLLAKVFAKEKNEAQRIKIKQLQAELKQCYEEKQGIKTKLVSPAVKFDAVDQTNPIETDDRPTNSVVQKLKPTESGVNSVNPQYSKLKDNLEIIEGVGPKMSELLKENNVNDWASLAAMSPKEIKEVLNKYGDRYRIIDPKSWPLQAELANQNQWNQLIAHQESEGGKSGKKGSSKLSKMLIKYGYTMKWKQDELKAIEGIGPKIASLLNEAGINTWDQLANTKPEHIKAILAKAGKRYALATPDSWPSQAKLAADGNFGGLEQLQAQLKGGK